MELSPYLVWIIGVLIIIIIAIIIAKKVQITFDGKELKISLNKTMKSNKIKINGENNRVDQDINNKKENTNKNNEIEIKGHRNIVNQDVGNSDAKQNKSK